jgi:hypothetical protein
MTTMTQAEALRAMAEKINWQGDDGLRDSVLEVFDADGNGDGLTGAETTQAGDTPIFDALAGSQDDAGTSTDDTSSAPAPKPAAKGATGGSGT